MLGEGWPRVRAHHRRASRWWATSCCGRRRSSAASSSRAAFDARRPLPPHVPQGRARGAHRAVRASRRVHRRHAPLSASRPRRARRRPRKRERSTASDDDRDANAPSLRAADVVASRWRYRSSRAPATTSRVHLISITQLARGGGAVYECICMNHTSVRIRLSRRRLAVSYDLRTYVSAAARAPADVEGARRRRTAATTGSRDVRRSHSITSKSSIASSASSASSSHSSNVSSASAPPKRRSARETRESVARAGGHRAAPPCQTPRRAPPPPPPPRAGVIRAIRTHGDAAVAAPATARVWTPGGPAPRGGPTSSVRLRWRGHRRSFLHRFLHRFLHVAPRRACPAARAVARRARDEAARRRIAHRPVVMLAAESRVEWIAAAEGNASLLFSFAHETPPESSASSARVLSGAEPAPRRVRRDASIRDEAAMLGNSALVWVALRLGGDDAPAGARARAWLASRPCTRRRADGALLREAAPLDAPLWTKRRRTATRRPLLGRVRERGATRRPISPSPFCSSASARCWREPPALHDSEPEDALAPLFPPLSRPAAPTTARRRRLSRVRGHGAVAPRGERGAGCSLASRRSWRRAFPLALGRLERGVRARAAS